MAVTARAGTAKPKAPPRRPRPALPPAEPDVIVSIGPADENEEAPEPERVPLFEIAGKVYTMLKEPPLTLSLESLDVADQKGGAGYAEIYVIREMIGSDALNALFDARKKGWLKRAQLDTIMKRVQAAAFGPEEDDSPKPLRRRIAQLMWLPAWLPDVESDMSAVHRVDDIYSMAAPRFFLLAWRLPHYQGVIRDQVLALQREQEEGPRAVAPPSGQQRTAARKPAASAQPVTEAALSDPVMSRIFEFG